MIYPDVSSPFDQTAVIDDPPPPPAADTPARKQVAIIVTIILSVATILVLALVIAEWIARSEVERTIADEFRATSGLPSAQLVQVEVSGPVLLQLLVQRFEEVTISSDNVNVGPVGGDFRLTAHGLSLDPAAGIESMSGEVRISGAQAAALFPNPGAVDVVFGSTEMSFVVDLGVGGQNVPFTVAVTPKFDAGRFMTDLSSVTLAGSTVTAAEVEGQLGEGAAARMQPTSTCIAETIPSGLHVTDVFLSKNELVMSFEIDPRITVDAALQQPGACA
ncbi:LmeA family phospholipid-binding protein [Microbacterium sp. P04]|uniref:LmeA family phospholipid-binding protein n=1 Tax=Microbacterium sp. P04 TaxID=3366947 RepID=UPI0037467458